MDKDDYAELVRSLMTHFRDAGLGDLADLTAYLKPVEDAPPGGEYVLPEPKALVRAMLEAYDRHLVLLDPETVVTALSRTGERLTGGEKPNKARVVAAADAATALGLRGLTEVGELRAAVRKLLDEL